MLLVKSAVRGIEQIYQSGYQLSKAGVMLMDLISDATMQSEFDFEAPEGRDKSRLMSAVDSINRRFGSDAIHVGSAVSAGARRDWSMKHDRLTPQYTTRWSDMPVVRA